MLYHDAPRAWAEGELARRIEQNALRLMQDDYDIPAGHEMNQREWPGDFRGRALLALAQHAAYGSSTAARRDALLADTLRCLSLRGYLGEEVGGVVNEQQLAGHSWLLRALVACAQQGAQEAAAAAERLFETLFLPCAAALDAYPLKRVRTNAGQPSGELESGVENGWRLSTDVGCAFIALDGLSAYYAFSRDARAQNALTAMLRLFARIDPEEVRMQTHATLTALRGALRAYRLGGDERLLALVRERFAAYCARAQTVNFANYNWFGRPQWTEPCGVVDSLMLAQDLFGETGERSWLRLANRIFFNGLLSSQRENGGFGCDSCVTRDGRQPLLEAHKGAYEAYWCCSMRGAEGLMAAAHGGAFEREGEIVLALRGAGRYSLEQAEVQIRGDFPWEEKVEIAFTGVRAPFMLRVLLPQGVQACDWPEGARREENDLLLRVARDGVVSLALEMPVRREALPGGGYTLWRGDLLLGGGDEATAQPVALRQHWAREALERRPLRLIF